MRTLLTASAAVLVLGVAACGGDSGSPSASTSSAPATAAATPAPQAVTLHESEFKIDPSSISVKAGTVTFNLANDGKFPHDLHIAPTGTTNEVGASSRMQAGGTTTLTVTLQPGTYDIWCGVPGHRANGMQGTVKVT